ncbi:MAG TPA: kelch repeat-containing protein [Mycobacteriales bacterium]|nr:kelch repeat-containing protein [Mycobacteriales bacterium]
MPARKLDKERDGDRLGIWWTRRRVIAGVVAMLLAGLSLPASAGSGTSLTWTETGSLNQARWLATATLLQSGDVLLVGGTDGNKSLAGAELYDPQTGQWTPTGSLALDRLDHVAALLPDGDVLVAGGTSLSLGSRSFSTEIYSPTTGTWHTGPDMNYPHSAAAVATLPDGRVLVAGGATSDVPRVPGVEEMDASPTAGGPSELYDPTTNTWQVTGRMLQSDQWLQSVVLPDGRVLVGCGNDPGDFEIYNPGADPTTGLTGLWQLTALDPHLRTHCAMSLLPDGRVLVVGGDNHTYVPSVPQEFSWSPSGTITIGGGNVSTVGGEVLASIYDPVANTWTDTAPLPAPRVAPLSVRLADGRVLVLGGTQGQDLTSTEVYTPSTGTWTSGGSLLVGRNDPIATLLTSGQVLVTGGGLPSSNLVGTPLAESEIGTP